MEDADKTWEAKDATTGTELHLWDFSLSGITLGDAFARVKQVFGEPDEVSVLKGLGLSLWVYRKQGLEVAFRVENGTPLEVNYISAGKGFTGRTNSGRT